MTLNEMKENLIKLGAVQRLSELNKERDVLLNLLGNNSKQVKAKEVMKSVKQVSKNRKWTDEQRAKFRATMRRKKVTNRMKKVGAGSVEKDG
jgi:hypothetical protein